MTNLETYVDDFQLKVKNILKDFCLEEQERLTELAVVQLGTELTDETYLRKLEELTN